MLMALAGFGVLRHQDSDWTVIQTGTGSKQHMQSDEGSLVGRVKIARYALTCFMMHVILSLCKPVGPADLRLAAWTDSTGQLLQRQPTPE